MVPQNGLQLKYNTNKKQESHMNMSSDRAVISRQSQNITFYKYAYFLCQEIHSPWQMDIYFVMSQAACITVKAQSLHQTLIQLLTHRTMEEHIVWAVCPEIQIRWHKYFCKLYFLKHCILFVREETSAECRLIPT
jgi:hypothetical protein